MLFGGVWQKESVVLTDLGAYGKEGELVAFCSGFRRAVIWAQRALQLPDGLLAFAVTLSRLSCFRGCLAS